MPLEKGAKPGSAGFKKIIKTEMKAGKPMKTAVAIAYSEAKSKKKPKHSDIKEDKALVKKMVKKPCLKRGKPA